MFKNIAWDFLGKFSAQLVRFIISVILARLLTPVEFGVVGMAMAVIIVAHIFLDLGFNGAIIQSKTVTQLQYSTIFYLNAAMALLLTMICYLLAEPLSHFYDQPEIAPVFKVLSLSFLLNGLNLVPAALLYRKLLLKLNSIMTIVASVLSGIAGVIMAIKGYGIWSLVTQTLLNSFLLLVLNFIYVKWLPSFSFNFLSLKPLWKYGSRMFASGFLDALYNRLDTFIIGKLFTVSILGYYTRAQSVDNFVRQFSVNSIMGALFPYIAKQQDNRVTLRALYVRYLHIISFSSIALSGILFLTAHSLFTVLFTARWSYSAELFQLIAIIGFAWPVSSLMCNIVAGVGNSKAFLRLEVYKKILFLPVYGFGFILGLKGFIFCFIGANFIAIILNAFFVSAEIAIHVTAQLKIIISYFISGILAVASSYYLYPYFASPNPFSSIFLLTAFFIFFYLLITFLFRLDAFKDATLIIKKSKQFFNDKRYKNVPSSF